MEHEGDGDISSNWWVQNISPIINKETGRLETKRTCGNNLAYCVIRIGQNTEKSPGDLKRFADTQISLKNYQLTLVWKTLKGVK